METSRGQLCGNWTKRKSSEWIVFVDCSADLRSVVQQNSVSERLRSESRVLQCFVSWNVYSQQNGNVEKGEEEKTLSANNIIVPSLEGARTT